MGLKELDEKISKDPFYQFCVKHKKAINIVQGVVIIGLLIGINSYVVKDYFIKQQIADHCGYVDSTYECVCEKHYVENWKELKYTPYLLINTSNINKTNET